MKIKHIQLNLTQLEFEDLAKAINGNPKLVSVMQKMKTIQERLDFAARMLERQTESS